MQTQARKSLRSPRPSAALIAACAAGFVACIGWIPASIGGPDSIVAPTAFAPGCAQRIGAESTLRRLRPGKAVYRGCNDIGSVRKVRMSVTSGRNRRCADDSVSAVAAAGTNQTAGNADLVLLLGWHMDAANGYGLGMDRVSCSFQSEAAMPMPIEASEAYENFAHFHGGSSQARQDTPRSVRQQGDPADALPIATE